MAIVRRPAIRAGAAALLLSLAAAGCGDGAGDVSAAPAGGADGPRPGPATTLPPAVNGVRVLYDDLWTVEEGQWWLGSADAYFGDEIPTFRQLLESVNSGAVSITVPGADGRYRARVELRDVPPSIASWCEDAAEASLEVPSGKRAITMGSFESFDDLPVAGAGWYRVRYCTEQQDRAAGEDAFVGEDYATYSGRHLIQVWPAPPAADEALREGSDWARRLTTARP